jgi:hypothetical protein
MWGTALFAALGAPAAFGLSGCVGLSVPIGGVGEGGEAGDLATAGTGGAGSASTPGEAGTGEVLPQAGTGGVLPPASGGAPTYGSGGGGGIGGSGAGMGATGGVTLPGDIELGEPESLACEREEGCSATFEWYPLDFEFHDLSRNGEILIGGSPALGLGYRLDWAEQRFEVFGGGGDAFLPLECDFTARTLIGSNPGFGTPQQKVDDGPVTPIPGLTALVATAISDDGTVIAGLASESAGFVLRDGVQTLVPGVTFFALSGDGEVAGGQRMDSERAVIWRDGEVLELPHASEATPVQVYALNEDGTVAVGGASPLEGSVDLYPFVWKDGVTELVDEAGPPGVLVDVDASGEIAIGHTPGGASWFIHTEADGVVELSQFFREHGLVVPDSFAYWQPRLSADGTRIAGAGNDRAVGDPSNWDGPFLWYAKLDD